MKCDVLWDPPWSTLEEPSGYYNENEEINKNDETSDPKPLVNVGPHLEKQKH